MIDANKFRSVLLALLLSAIASPAFADRIQLTDAMLDRVEAGYLRISAEAFARASGLNSEAVTLVNTSVNAERVVRNFSYTFGRATAFAFAAGDETYVNANAFFETDEEVVRSSTRVTQRFRSNARAMGRRLGLEIPRGSNYSQIELHRVNLRVVTRVRLN